MFWFKFFIFAFLIGGLATTLFYLNWKKENVEQLSVSLVPTEIEILSSSLSQEKINEKLAQLQQKYDSLYETHHILENQIKELEQEQKYWQQQNVGRALLTEFSDIFAKYPTVLTPQNWSSTLQSSLQTYIKYRTIEMSAFNQKSNQFTEWKNEIYQWVLTKQVEDVQAFARFFRFHLIESFYGLPLTLVSSGLLRELQEINYELKLEQNNQQIVPVRNAFGELSLQSEAYLDRYNHTQQFFYRRGPKFTKRVIWFLEEYLSYETPIFSE